MSNVQVRRRVGVPEQTALRSAWGVRIGLGMAVFLALGSPVQSKTVQSTDELVNLVIDAVRTNYSVIESAKLTLHEVREDATVTKEQVVVRSLPQGGEDRIALRPRAEWDLRVTLRGEDMRVDRLAANLGSSSVVEAWSRREGIWTQYSARGRAAWVRRPDGLPGMFPFDPRQLGSDDIQRTIEDILREDRIQSAEFAKSAEGGDIVRIVAETAKGARLTYEFAAAQNFLPTRFYTQWPDQSLLQVVNIDYQDVLSGKAKFLKHMTRCFYPKSASWSPTDESWKERLTREVVGEIAFNQEVLDQELQVALPPGTRLHDTTRKVIYATRLPVPEEPLSTWWYVLAIVSLLLLLVWRRASYGNAAS